jgi:glycine betaine/proline transport system permease protein
MVTLAMVISAVIFCAVVGIPLGIVAARSDRMESVIRPVLDVMQTTPSFVYLVPVVMLIGIGSVAAVIATIIFSMPPVVRLTNLGIRQVQADVVEAAYAFGATPTQVLREIQVPLALRTIMAGMNQTLMLALSMVVIASLIGGGGLGTLVRQGLNNIQPGIGFLGGIGIVLIAIVLDRITQALGQASNPSTRRWSITSVWARLTGDGANHNRQAVSVTGESVERGEQRKESSKEKEEVSVSSD